MDTPEHVQHVEDEIVAFIRKTRARSMQAAARIDPELDLSGYLLLVELYQAEARGRGPVRGSDLAEIFQVHKSTVSRGLAALEGLGLVERETDPSDARARLARLTTHGRERLESTVRERRAALVGALSDWSVDDMATLARLISRLNHDIG